MGKEATLEEIQKRIIGGLYLTVKTMRYGMYSLTYEVYTFDNEGVLLLNSPNTDIYILLDKYFNTITIEKVQINNHSEKEKFVVDSFIKYGMETIPNLGYPFTTYTLQDINRMDDTIGFIRDVQGNYVGIKDGKLINVELDERHFLLLEYLKFLKKKMEIFWQVSIHLQLLGLPVPSIKDYVTKLVAGINEEIARKRDASEQLSIWDLKQSYGEFMDKEEDEGTLKNIVKLFNLTNNGEDLVVVAQQLWSILNEDAPKPSFKEGILYWRYP